MILCICLFYGVWTTNKNNTTCFFSCARQQVQMKCDILCDYDRQQRARVLAELCKASTHLETMVAVDDDPRPRKTMRGSKRDKLAPTEAAMEVTVLDEDPLMAQQRLSKRRKLLRESLHWLLPTNPTADAFPIAPPPPLECFLSSEQCDTPAMEIESPIVQLIMPPPISDTHAKTLLSRSGFRGSRSDKRSTAYLDSAAGNDAPASSDIGAPTTTTLTTVSAAASPPAAVILGPTGSLLLPDFQAPLDFSEASMTKKQLASFVERDTKRAVALDEQVIQHVDGKLFHNSVSFSKHPQSKMHVKVRGCLMFLFVVILFVFRVVGTDS